MKTQNRTMVYLYMANKTLNNLRLNETFDAEQMLKVKTRQNIFTN